MSADVRALLKAKTQERSKKITHPLAAYNTSGQLRCTLCATVVKDNEVAWSGHLGSKGHRTNVGRQKEVMVKEEERKRLEKGKRKALVEEDNMGESMDEDEDSGKLDPNGPVSKRQKTEEPEKPAGAIPSSFFSDPNRALPTQGSDGEEDGQSKPGAPPTKNSQIDLEWAAFERDVLARSANASNAMQEDGLSKQDIFDRATVAASEQIVEEDEGIPEHLQLARNRTSTTAAAGRNLNAEILVDIPEDETQEQKRERLVRDEKELIMDRIMEEERAQEDADEKLRALKARLALIKKKREDEKKKKGSGS